MVGFCFERQFLASLEAGEGDLTVTVRDGTQLQAHSCVLVVCSPVLRATLTGPMLEALARHINMDCDAEEARAFLRFLYIGGLRSDLHLTSLDLTLAVMRLSDFYGVLGEFAQALREEKASVAFAALLEASAKDKADSSDLIVMLAPLLAESVFIRDMLLGCLDLALGSNVYKCLCHALAFNLGDIQNLCKQAPASNPFHLENEVNEDIVRKLLHVHSRQPDVVSQAMDEFMLLCRDSFPPISGRPVVGEGVRIRSGAVGVLLRDDGSGSPFLVELVSGGVSWHTEANVARNFKFPMEKIEQLASMVKALVVGEEQQGMKRARKE